MKLLFILVLNALITLAALADKNADSEAPIFSSPILGNMNITEKKLEGMEYIFAQDTTQKIHIIKIDLNNYDVALRSAHNSVFGREKIGDIAERENASIAINAGFFEIGKNEDGRSTGTLIIDGKLFGLRTTPHAVFAIRNQVPSVEIWHPKIELNFGKTKIIPQKFNKFAGNSSIILYSDKWGSTTLTPYKFRKEVIVNENRVITGINEHGNNPIPPNGYVLSLPLNVHIEDIILGDQVEFYNDEYSIFDKKTSAVMGIPFLIMNNKINKDLSDTKNHARTAIGVDKEGRIIIVVVECAYTKPLSAITLKEANEIFQKNNISINDWKIEDVKEFLIKKLSNDTTASGLTIKELAALMQELGCTAAINLDGGGSSSLYIKGKYINRSIGDQDENESQAEVRPVSEAIIFKKK